MRGVRFALPLAVAVLAASSGSGSAWADGPAPSAAPKPSSSAAPVTAHSAVAEILVIHATKEDAAAFLDPRIGRLPHLGKKPFSDYTSFKLVEKKLLTLEKGRPESYAMVTGRTLRVALENVTSDHRYVVEASIDQPGKPEYLKLLEVTAAANEPFFVGGQSYKGGTLILSITMRPDAR
jgi:hypothetical protein